MTISKIPVEPDRESVLTRVIHAPRAMVFAALKDPAALANWWGPRGFKTHTQSMDFTEGGQWVFVMTAADGTEFKNLVTYQQIVEPELIVMDHTDGSENDPNGHITTIILEDQGDCTLIHLRAKFRTPEIYRQMRDDYQIEAGGQQTLQRLDEAMTASHGFVIERVFDASQDLMFEVWSQKEHLAKWGGSEYLSFDFSEGGRTHYKMSAPGGGDMYGVQLVQDIQAPHRICYIQHFSDEKGGVTRHPLDARFPEKMLTTITFKSIGPKQTKVTITWVPLEASAEDKAFFEESKPGMAQGWSHMLDGVTAYIKEIQK